MSLREANLWFLAFLEVRESIFSIFSGPIRILAQKSTKITQLQLGMCLLTYFMAKTVLRNEFKNDEFMVFAFLKVSESIFSIFSGPIRILAQKSTKIAQLQLGMCLLTHFMAKTVLRNEFTRSKFMVLGPFEGK